jgi:dihydrofolate synthase/folylpolyglutamate synthase
VTFRVAVEYLLSLGNEVSAMKLSLENIRKLLPAIGDPQNNYLKVQVAGTNGKGSVCAFLDSICNTAGIKTGTFTSPHLVSITERIRINGRDISEDDFAHHTTSVRDTAEQMLADGELEYRPTFFEQITAIALVAFADAGVELAILETGMGGRLDATTAANAEIAAITRIDFDHQEYLGKTIEEIAAEKAAIIHEGSKVVIGQQSNDAMRVILDRCRELKIIPRAAGKRYMWQLDISTKKTTIAEFDVDPPAELGALPGLRGRHQIENAYTAIMVAGELANEFNIELSEEDVRHGIESARHPGRLDYQGKYRFDGAHNVGGAKALAEYLDEFEKRPVTMIFGAMRGKNVAEMLKILAPICAEIVFTVPANTRSLSYHELLDCLQTMISREHTFATDTVAKAIDIAETVMPEDGVILVTGSLYLVGEVKKIIDNKVGRRRAGVP